MNWINGFKATNKKEKYQLEFRLGTFSIIGIVSKMLFNG